MEVGRVALVAEGLDKGKLCVIVDIINQRSVGVFLPLSWTVRGIPVRVPLQMGIYRNIPALLVWTGDNMGCAIFRTPKAPPI